MQSCDLDMGLTLKLAVMLLVIQAVWLSRACPSQVGSMACMSGIDNDKHRLKDKLNTEHCNHSAVKRNGLIHARTCKVLRTKTADKCPYNHKDKQLKLKC